MRILIADDDEALLLILRRRLEAMGHEVSSVTDGDRAWRLFLEGRFPLVISDWMMPGLDGLSLCRRIREDGRGSYTYVILLTSRAGRGDRVEGLRAGADDFLSKPIDGDELAVRLEIARRILGVQAKLERQHALLEALATTDGLTGLKNRRVFQEELDSCFALATREGMPLSLVLLDVDHFKGFNDSFGHPAGDDVLRDVGTILNQNLREHETAARYGGEEFAMILLGATAGGARELADRLRRIVAGWDWRHRPVTASFGIATATGDVSSAEDLTDRADRALYRSKRSGRDRVTHFDEEGRDDDPRPQPGSGPGRCPRPAASTMAGASAPPPA